MRISVSFYCLLTLVNFVHAKEQEEYRFPLKKEFSLPLNFHLSVQNEIGTIELRSHLAQNLIVEAEKVVRARGISQKEAEEYVKTIKIEILQQNKETKILTEFLQKSTSIGRTVDYKIFVPKNAGKFNIRQKVGKVKINDIRGSINIETEVGNISVERVQKGGLRIKVGKGNVELTDVESTSDIEVGVGKVSLERVKKEPKIKIEKGKVKLIEISPE